jgi:hypothetical protein
MDKIGRWALALCFCVLSFALAVRVATYGEATLMQSSHGYPQIVSAACWGILVFCLGVVAVRKMRGEARRQNL